MKDNLQVVDSRDPYGDGNNLMSIDNLEVVAKQIDSNTRGLRGLQLSNGTILSYSEIMDAILANRTTGLMISTGQYGEYVKSRPDGDYDNNIDSLPVIE